MPKVSVIISTYNRPEKLKKAIGSVLNQTYKDYEVIVIHDGPSIDWMVGQPSSPKVRYLHLEKNFGCDTKPKNTGILESKGEYIAFLDDDNQFRPDHLAALVAELDRSPEVDLVYGQRWLIDNDGQIPAQIGSTSEYIPGLLMERNYIDTSDVLVRREALFRVGGFDERYKKYIDWNLWIRMEKARMLFKRVSLILTDYFLDSSSKSLKVLTNREQAFMKKNDGQFRNIPDWDAADMEIELPYLGPVKKPRVAIFSITYDRLEYTKKCFYSMYKTAGYEFDHYIVDNGSKDETVDWLKSQGKRDWCEYIQLIPNLENKGISAASNQAINSIMITPSAKKLTGEEAETKNYDIIVKVDNDCFFHNQGWLAKMVEIWKANHRIALSCYVQGLKDNPGGAPRLFRGQIKGEVIGITKHIGGICHFVDASAYKDFRWDEHSFLHGVQDVELSQYLLSQGFQMGYLENWYCEHFEGTEGQHKRYPEYFERRKFEKVTRYETNKQSKH